MVKRIDVAGLQIDAITKSELFELLEQRMSSGEQTFVTTPFSEFLYAALRDKHIRQMLNSADIAFADGVGVIWAQYFLSQPLTAQSFYGKILQAWWQVVYTGAQILLQPHKIYQVIPEKIVGAEFIWDLAEWARGYNHSVYLLGWYNQRTEQVKEVLEKTYPGLKIAGYANARPAGLDSRFKKGDTKLDLLSYNDLPVDHDIVGDIQKAQPDLLLVGFGHLKQEAWLDKHLPLLSVKIAVGLGGSFDYVIGKTALPPKFIRTAGLEWLYRLFTQPTRVRRIYQAFWGLILSVVRFKVFESLPLRENGVAVVINKDNKILVCRRTKVPKRVAQEQLEYWQFPQGGLDKNESIITGTTRELAEETGIHSVEVLGVADFINSYHWENSWRPLLSAKFKNPGQIQHTVFFRFLGDDSEIKLDTHELRDYQWLDFAEAIEQVAEERRHLTEKVLAELAELLKNK